jgi:hypothetical protein
MLTVFNSFMTHRKTCFVKFLISIVMFVRVFADYCLLVLSFINGLYVAKKISIYQRLQ